MTRGQRVTRWLEALTVTEGPRAGEPLRLLPFQRRFVRGMLKHDEAALSVARGNGKSTLAASLAACAFCGPLAQPRGQIIMVASSFPQALVPFRHTVWFLRPVFDADPRRWRVIDNSHDARIEDRVSGMTMRAVGSDPRRAHGLAPTLVIADEPAQWPTNDGDRMHAAMVTGLGKHAGGRFVAIGTRPDDPRHWFARMLAGGPGVYGQTHAAADDADPFAWRSVRAANPALDHMPALPDVLRREREQARLGGSDLARWRALRLNQGTADAALSEPIVTVETWIACYADGMPPREGPVFVGFDLGEATSMTAAACYWPETGRFEVRAAFPSEPVLADRGRADGVDTRYVRMAELGELRAYPGKVTNVGRFLGDLVRDLAGQEVLGAAADRYKQKTAEQALAEAGAFWPMEWRGVGTGADGIADITAFQSEVIEGRLRGQPSLLMESAISDSKLERDRNGNPYLDKARQRGRIDGLQAAVLAVGLGRRWRLPTMEEESPLARYYGSGGKVEIVGV